MRGHEAIKKVAEYTDIKTVLDIGSWNGEHAKYLISKGFNVTTIDMNVDADINGNYLNVEIEPFDCIWCSHVLEHQPNVNIFLKKCFNDLKDNGLLAITVPSGKKYYDKERIVDGHLTYWNAGLLLYNLVVAGFNCSKARVLSYADSEISVLVKKVKADLLELSGDRGELERLSKFFPMPVQQGFNGFIAKLNW
jgi:SAM-dependent methyltransferase